MSFKSSQLTVSPYEVKMLQTCINFLCSLMICKRKTNDHCQFDFIDYLCTDLITITFVIKPLISIF